MMFYFITFSIWAENSLSEGQISPHILKTVLNMPVACCDKVLYFLEHLLSCNRLPLLQLVIPFVVQDSL